MRFNSPDSWSPFGEGGPNAYMYCGADPINRSDPTGHFFVGILSTIQVIVGLAGTVTFVTGRILENETISYIGLGITMAGTVTLIGRTGYKAINARITATTANRPPPSYRTLFPNGRRNSLPPSTIDPDIEMSSLRTSISSNSSLPTYEQAWEMSRLSYTNPVNSSVLTSSQTTSNLQLRNATDGIRQR